VGYQCVWAQEFEKKKKATKAQQVAIKLRGFSPQVNYTDRAIAAG
jgi:hypothetical protein